MITLYLFPKFFPKTPFLSPFPVFLILVADIFFIL